MKQLYAEPGWVDPRRQTVETGGHPWIRLEFRDVGEPNETVHIQAAGIPEENVMPVLQRIVQAYARPARPPE